MTTNNALVRYINNKNIGPDIDTINEYTAETLPDPATLPVGTEVEVGGKVATSQLGSFSTLPSITPYPRNRAGIVAAINVFKNLGISGVIQYEDAVYDISDTSAGPIIPYKGIDHIGVPIRFSFTGHVPDSQFTVLGGTIFDGGGVAAGFELNNIDQASATSAVTASWATIAREAGKFASNGQGGHKIHNIVGRNCTRFIDTGAVNNIGLLYCDLQWLVAENCKSDWAMRFHNFQHCYFANIFAKTNLSSGSGIDFASSVDGTLLSGNSTALEIYNFCVDQRSRGVRISGCSTGAGCQLNEFKTGRIQSNRYGVSTLRSISVTSTSGSPYLTVSAADAAWLKPDMTIVFTASAPQWLALNETYWVQSVDTTNNLITLAPNALPKETEKFTFNNSGTFTGYTGGFPSLEIIANTNSLITASDFTGGFDIECTGSTSPIVIQRIRTSSIRILEQFGAPGGTGSSIVVRDANGKLEHMNLSGHTTDYGTNLAAQVIISNMMSRTRLITAAETLTSAAHEHTLVNNTTSDYVVTVPKRLVKGFKLKLVQGSTGKITLAPASGVTITNAVGLSTAGAGTSCELVEITANSYILVGSTAA